MKTPHTKKPTTKVKRVKYKDNLVLTHGMFEIHWVNDVAVEVAIEGVIFTNTIKQRTSRTKK